MTNSRGSGTNGTELKMDDQLKTLFEYTKWHIGLFAGLITVLIAVLHLYGAELSLYMRLVVLASLVFFVLAGGAGGIVVSGIPFYQEFEVFMKSKLLPIRKWDDIKVNDTRRSDLLNTKSTKCLTGKWWYHLEHLMFWIGIGVAVVGIAGNEIIQWFLSGPA